MNETDFRHSDDRLLDDGSAPYEDSSAEEPAPEFGLLDVIEAFTAMRHEWRQHTRENRELAETIESTAKAICQFEEKLDSSLTRLSDTEFKSVKQANENNAIPDRSIIDLVDSLIEFDVYLSRAVDAAASAQATASESALASAIQTTYDNMNFVSRWIGKNFLDSVHELVKVDQHSGSDQAPGESIFEGLVLLLSRLRRTLDRHQIVRRETVDQPFDATMMRAIGTVPSHPDRPVVTGRVVEQLAPAYLWNEKVIRFAEVRVAQ